MTALRAVIARPDLGFLASPQIIVELTNTDAIPYCNVLNTGLTLRDAAGMSLLENDGGLVWAPIEVTVPVAPVGSFVPCIGPGVSAYAVTTIDDVNFDSVVSVELGLTAENPFAYDSNPRLVPESYTVDTLTQAVSIVLHNPGTAAAHRPTLFPEGQLIMLDDSDRPMWSISLQEATLSALQPDQRMTVTTQQVVFPFHGSSTRLRAFVPFD